GPRRGARAQEPDHPLRPEVAVRGGSPHPAGGQDHRLRPPGRGAHMEGNSMTYHVPQGGLPPQTALTTDRAVFTESYAVLPARTMSDITPSLLPQWVQTRLWVLARPLSGFAETFAQYLVEVSPGGGSDSPEPDQGAEGVLFVVGGQVQLTVEGAAHTLTAGGYAYLAPGARWTLHNTGTEAASFHWIRKRYQPAEGVSAPESFVTTAQQTEAVAMPDTDGAWATKRFADPADLRHD